MANTVYDTILARRSIRKYTAEPVAPEQIRRLLEAAMAGPSGHNAQPWHFLVVTKRGTLDRLADRHQWAKMLYEAPLCIAVCGDPASEFWVHDCAAAAQSILLTATEMGLGSVWLCVHPHPDLQQMVRETLGVPSHIEPLCLVALGHPAEEKEPRTGYTDSRVHHERW
jgi:nitroreductase